MARKKGALAGLGSLYLTFRQALLGAGELDPENLELLNRVLSAPLTGSEALPPGLKRALSELRRFASQPRNPNFDPHRPDVFRLKGLKKTLGEFFSKLIVSPEEFLTEVGEFSRGLEESLADSGPRWIDPEDQRVFAKLELWSDESRLELLSRSARGFEEKLKASFGSANRPRSSRLKIEYLLTGRQFWKVAPERREYRVAVSELFFLDQAREIPDFLVSYLLNPRARHKRVALRAWTRSPAVIDYLLALDARVKPLPWLGQGLIHDLGEIWERVNQAEFGGRLARPHLEWSKRFAVLRTGSYNPFTNTISISPALDHPETPEEVLDYLLFHEMLHQASRVELLSGESRAHDREFRRRESSHPAYQRAEAHLRALAGQV